MQVKYKNLSEQEFRVIKALGQTHKVSEVTRITGRSYPVVKRVQSVENYDEYRKDFRKPGPKPVKKDTPYMDQMIGLLTEIRDELRGYNARIDARLYEETNKKKRSWF